MIPPTMMPSLEKVKPVVNEGMKKIKPYRGPSRIWFRYQRDLSAGSNMIEEAVANLNPTSSNAKYIWSLVKRLDRKLSNGVDDSEGSVGGCMMFLVETLARFVKEEPKLFSTVEKFCGDAMGFDFNTILEGLIDELRVDGN